MKEWARMTTQEKIQNVRDKQAEPQCINHEASIIRKDQAEQQCRAGQANQQGQY